MFKKTLKALVVLLIAIALVACTTANNNNNPGNNNNGNEPKGGNTYDLTLWGSQEDQDLLAELVEDFKATDPDNTYNITLGVVGEPDAKDTVLADLDASADVFAFANDQIRDLVSAGALYEITLNKDEITAANMDGAIEAVTLDGKMYGYPFTADNGYFLYYNSEVITDEEAGSFEAIMDKAEAEGKKVYFDLSNGWYISSFFLGAGGKLELGEDGKQVLDWNNETGVKVGEYIREFAKSPAFITGADEILDAGINDGSIVAAVSGTWKADLISAAYGEGYAATKLPTIDLDGEEVQLSSFAGYKVYGVNTVTKHPEQAMALAEFLSNEASQIKRFEQRKLGPSNLVAAESDAVKADVALNALAEQGIYAVSQKDVVGTYWTPAEAFGTEMENGSTADMQTLLDSMVEQIQQ